MPLARLALICAVLALAGALPLSALAGPLGNDSGSSGLAGGSGSSSLSNPKGLFVVPEPLGGLQASGPLPVSGAPAAPGAVGGYSTGSPAANESALPDEVLRRIQRQDQYDQPGKND